MSRESLVFLIGFLVILIPFLGIPNDWMHYLSVGVGVLLVLVGYSLRRSKYLRSLEQENGDIASDSFVESVIDDKTEPINFDTH